MTNCEHKKIQDKILKVNLIEEAWIKAKPIQCPDCKLFLVTLVEKDQK